MKRELREGLRIIPLRRSEADVPGRLTEPGKWLDGGTLLFKGAFETPHQFASGQE